MSNIAVVYYSLEGNTDYIAQAVAESAQASLIRLRQEKEIPATGLWRYFSGGKMAGTKATPPLQQPLPDLSQVELIFLGTPVWASTFAPALRTLLQSNNLAGKKIAVFTCFAGNPGRAESELRSLCSDAEFLGGIGFKNPLKNKQEGDLPRARQWAAEIIAKAQAN